MMYVQKVICVSNQLIVILYSDQPPRFTLEPQGALLATTRNGNPIGASLYCSYNSSSTTVTWYRESTQITSGGNRVIHDNGTLEFNPLIANVDLTEDGVEYRCVLSNAFGRIISRAAILKLPSKLINYVVYTMFNIKGN